MKRVSFLAGLIAFLWLTFAFLPSAHAVPGYFLINHWMDYKCSTYPCGSYPYYNLYTCYQNSCSVDWVPIPGVTSYYAKSLSFWGDSVIIPPNHERGLGGGSGTLGDCTFYWLCAPPYTCNDMKPDCEYTNLTLRSMQCSALRVIRMLIADLGSSVSSMFVFQSHRQTRR